MEAARRAKCKKLGALPFDRKERGREGRAAASSAGPPEALAGGRWLGGRILELPLAKSDEPLVVERDGAEVPGGLHGLRRLHVDRDRVVVLFLDFPGRVLDLLR